MGDQTIQTENGITKLLTWCKTRVEIQAGTPTSVVRTPVPFILTS